MPTVLFSSFPIIADYKDVPVYLEASSSLIRPALFYESTIHCSWRYKMNQAGGSSQIRKWQLLFKQISQKLVMTEDSITLHMHLTLSTISFSKRRCNKITHWKDLGIKKKKEKRNWIADLFYSYIQRIKGLFWTVHPYYTYCTLPGFKEICFIKH